MLSFVLSTVKNARLTFIFLVSRSLIFAIFFSKKIFKLYTYPGLAFPYSISHIVQKDLFMNKRPCWSWRYRNRFAGRFSVDQCNRLWSFCQNTFDTYVNRYEITYRQRRLNPYGIIPKYYYTNVTVHFRHQDDLVLFKLTYEPQV